METRTRARELWSEATPSERTMWRALRARKILGVRFDRQVPIGSFTCEFVSRSTKRIVDGGQHGRQAHEDQRRTRYLESQGYRVIRLWNPDVLERREGVVTELDRVIAARPSPDPSRKLEGK